MRRHKLKRITVDDVDCRDGVAFICHACSINPNTVHLCEHEFYCIVMYNYRIVTSTYVISFVWCDSRASVADIRRMRAFEVALIRQYYNAIQRRAQYVFSI